MARKRSNENPQLDMTPMIDVVFELIIFFVVTLTQATAKDETVRLEDGKHGIELTPDKVPENHLVIEIAERKRWRPQLLKIDTSKDTPRVQKEKLQKHAWRGPCISMCNVPVTVPELKRHIRERVKKIGEFPVMIRADQDVRHEDVAAVMGACTENGIWKISFVAIHHHPKKKDN